MTELPEPVSVLFICMGNICRSPLAEGIFRHKVEQRGASDRFFIDSAGTGGWHVGAPPDERMQVVAAEHGIALDSAARQVDRDDFSRFHHLLCADEDNREDLLGMGAPPKRVRLLLECDPAAPMIEVPDPYYGGADGFQLVYRLVESACEALAREMLDERS